MQPLGQRLTAGDSAAFAELYDQCAILRAGPVAAELHRELDAALTQSDTADGFLRSLRSKRPYGLQAIEDLNVGGWFSRALNNDQKCHYLDRMAEWEGLADKTYAQVQNYNQSMKQESGTGYRG